METRRSSASFCCICTAVFSFLAHGYRYLSMSFSGDAALLTQAGEEAYQTSLGRFLQPVYWQIRGYITAPLLIGLFATAFLMGSCVLLVRLFGLTGKADIALLCGILAANETLAASNATYLPWTDVYMLSMLLCVAGVYVFFQHKWGFLLSSVLFCLSLGLYQSYIAVAATVFILALLCRSLDGEAPGKIWASGIKACLSLLLGLILYAAVLQLVLGATGAQASQDYNGVGRVGLMDVSTIPALLLETYTAPLRFLFSLSDTPVMTWHISPVPSGLNIAVLLLSALLLILRLRFMKPGAVLTVLFLLAVLPLGMNFVQFIADGIVSGLMIYAYFFFYLLPMLLHTHGAAALPSRPERAQHIACGAASLLLSALLMLNIYNANLMSFKRDIEFSATLSAVTRLLDQAEQTQGYVPGETPVVLIGMLPSSYVSMERSGFEDIARAQGMRYTYAASYETGNYWYLQMALGVPINLVDHSDRVQLDGSGAMQAMPSYPLDGCCQMIDGMLYIKLS